MGTRQVTNVTNRRTRVTIRDLAARAGVSPATASNAFNPARRNQLSPHLRDRILVLAAEIGFTGPDPSGRALRVGRSGAIGVLVPTPMSSAFCDPAATEFLAGLAEGLHAHAEGMEAHATNIVLVPVGHGDADLAAVRRAAVDAFALLGVPDDHPAATLARTRGIPLVGASTAETAGLTTVSRPMRERGRLVAQLIHELRRCPSGAVAGDLDARPSSGPARQRSKPTL